MSDEFEIEEFTECLKESHPQIIKGLMEETNSSNNFEIDQFERNLVKKYPKIAEKIYEFDEKVVNEEREKSVSKKQQARDRQGRLAAMMTEGRTVTEGKEKTYHDRLLEEKGIPTELLAKAVKNQTKLEIRTGGEDRMDRMFEGILTTFDVNCNLLVNDATETVLRERISLEKESTRMQMQSLLPEYLRWKEGGKWPVPIGANFILEHRCHRTSFIKGGSVVLIRTIK